MNFWFLGKLQDKPKLRYKTKIAARGQIELARRQTQGLTWAIRKSLGASEKREGALDSSAELRCPGLNGQKKFCLYLPRSKGKALELGNGDAPLASCFVIFCKLHNLCCLRHTIRKSDMARAITCWLKQVWSPKVRHSQSYCSNAQACSETFHSFLNHKLQDSVLVEKESALPQFSAEELKKKLFEVKAQRESLKEKKRQEVKDRLRREREEYLAKQPKTQEDVLLQRIELVTHKIESRQRLLKKYEVPDIHKEYKETEDLSPELRHYYKKMGQKYKNYVPVGRRGIYGGTIQNLHMHWKKHETCRVDCHMFSMDQARHMAEELSKLTGGVVIDILHDKTIILFRGMNYQRPDQLIPENMLDKRKALKKSLLQQSVNSLQGHLSTLQEELRQRTLLRQTGSTGLVPLIIPKKKMTIELKMQEDDIPEVEEYNYWVKKAFF